MPIIIKEQVLHGCSARAWCLKDTGFACQLGQREYSGPFYISSVESSKDGNNTFISTQTLTPRHSQFSNNGSYCRSKYRYQLLTFTG